MLDAAEGNAVLDHDLGSDPSLDGLPLDELSRTSGRYLRSDAVRPDTNDDRGLDGRGRQRRRYRRGRYAGLKGRAEVFPAHAGPGRMPAAARLEGEDGKDRHAEDGS